MSKHKRETAVPRVPSLTEIFRRWPLMPLTAGLVVACVFSICLWLWRFPDFRPYLATGGAAVAAFAGPLPALLTPELRGKWVFAVAISALITAGVWFASKDLQDQLQRSQIDREELSGRLDGLVASVGNTIRQETPDQQSAAILSFARYERNLYRERRYWLILDTAKALLEIDPENGHGLYYAGEAYRHFHDWDNMRDMFRKYVATAEARPESATGDARTCYDRSNGYCMERLAYIDHLMAIDALAAARDSSGGTKIDELHVAFHYERDELTLRPFGFLADGQIPSSCDVLRAASRELVALNTRDANVDNFLDSKKKICG